MEKPISVHLRNLRPEQEISVHLRNLRPNGPILCGCLRSFVVK